MISLNILKIYKTKEIFIFIKFWKNLQSEAVIEHATTRIHAFLVFLSHKIILLQDRTQSGLITAPALYM